MERKACIKVCMCMRTVYWIGVYVLYVSGSLAKSALKYQIMNSFAGLSLVFLLLKLGTRRDCWFSPESVSESKSEVSRFCLALHDKVTSTRVYCRERIVTMAACLDRSVSCDGIHTSCLRCRRPQTQLSYNTVQIPYRVWRPGRHFTK